MAHKTQGFSHGLNGFNGWGANKLPYKCAPSLNPFNPWPKNFSYDRVGDQ